jgi:hypothetical protein
MARGATLAAAAAIALEEKKAPSTPKLNASFFSFQNANAR